MSPEDIAAIDLGCQDSGVPLECFFPGQVCTIVGVHHFCFVRDIGKRVVIVKVSPDFNSVWAHDDRPIRYRTNRQGRQVIDFDPRCIQHCISIQYLMPVQRVHRGWPWVPSGNFEYRVFEDALSSASA